MMTTISLPNCPCCNPLWQYFVALLSRPQFLLGTGGFAAAVLSGNREPANSQTESSEDSKALARSQPTVTIYVARKVITMESGQPEATAVAIEGDRILAVGSLDKIKEYLGSQPYTVDLTFENKIMLPGFVEHHVHPLLGALTMALEIIAIEDWKVPGKFSPAAPDNSTYIARLQAALGKMSTANPEETLFTWGYHHYFHGALYRSELDEISPNRPIVTWHRSCHEFILNTAALNKYGVTESSLQGHGLASEQASWERGHFFETGMEIILPFIAKDILAPGRSQAGLSIFKEYLLSKGITTICEPGTQMVRRLQEFWENGLDTDDTCFRTYFIPDGRVLFARHKNNPETLVTETQKYLDWGRGKVRWLPKQVKLFTDGAIFSQLMQVQESYLDGHAGQWLAVPEDYTSAFKIYWDAGYQINTHVNGDAALQVVVDTLSQNMKANPRQEHRFTVVHFAVSTEEQVEHLGKLGAIVTANPYYVTSLADRYSEFGLGPARANTMVRLGSVEKQGMVLSLHSDMPMAPADPLFLAWCAVNRITVSGRVAAPEQRISVQHALEAITLKAAYCLGLEEEIGSIKPGKKADFTILEEDPLTTPAERLKDIPVWGCVFEGRKFEAPPDDGITAAISAAVYDPEDINFVEMSRVRG